MPFAGESINVGYCTAFYAHSIAEQIVGRRGVGVRMREGCIQWDEQGKEGMCREGRKDEEI